MTRRTFLSAAALAATSASVVASAGAKVRPQPSSAGLGSRPARTLRKAVMLGMAQVAEGSSLVETFKVIRECGFDGVEVDWPSRVKVDEYAAAQDRSGLRIHGLVDSVHWKLHLNASEAAVRDQAREALLSCIDAAKVLGAGSILLVPGVVNAGSSYADCYRLSQEELAKVAPVAKAAGVHVSIENVWNNFLLSPLEAARYVDELNRGENTGPFAFHFDIGNVINTGFPHQWIRILGSRISRIHIKDFSRKKRDDQGLWKGFDVELGEGDAMWSEVMKALDDIGYSTSERGNWATAEVRGGDAARLKQVSEQMDRLFAM